jgi:3-oxoadipate enol-lactonase
MPDSIVNGVRLRYEILGDKGPFVVLLNGIAMSIGHWQAFAERLSASFRVLCHDLRGQTLSERPAGDYSFDQHSRDLSSLMEKLGIDKAHIVGTSYGSEVAMSFALAHPEKTLSLTVIDGVSEIDPLLRATAESWMSAALTDPRVFYKTLLPWTYSSEFIGANRQALDSREDAVASLPKDWFEAFVGLCRAFLALDITDSLYRVTCPSLVVVGELDILKHRGFASTIAEHLGGPVKLVEIPGAGHAAVIEKPGETADVFLAFFKEFGL